MTRRIEGLIDPLHETYAHHRYLFGQLDEVCRERPQSEVALMVASTHCRVEHRGQVLERGAANVLVNSGIRFLISKTEGVLQIHEQ